MHGQASTKLNRLLRVWPQGTVAASRWLEQQGAYQQLRQTYEKGGWIERIGQGGYIRAGEMVEWTGGLYALQRQLRLSVHAAAKTALQMHGYAHFLPLGKGAPVTLFGSAGVRLPGWFRRHAWGVSLCYVATRMFLDDPDMGLADKAMGNWSVRLSAPERAMMELLYLVPDRESFSEASLLMEGLTTLRPGLVQSLLEQCRSIKVKRLFMFLAEHHNHPWVKRLDLSKVDFGKGKRMLVKGGCYDTKYRITVPAPDFDQEKPAF